MLITTVSGNQAMIKPNCEICARKQNTIQSDKPVYLDGHERFVANAAHVGKCFMGMRWREER